MSQHNANSPAAEDSHGASAPASPTAPDVVWAERTGTRQYLGHNSRGASVRIGVGPGEFSPGELLKLALATCNSLSADHRLARALGEEFDANVVCSANKHGTQERYESLQVELVADLSGLEPTRLKDLTSRVESAIDRHCTVGHTLEQGAPFSFALRPDPDA